VKLEYAPVNTGAPYDTKLEPFNGGFEAFK